MAYTRFYPMFGGESRDSALEVLNQIRTSDCTVDTTAAGISSGSRCVKFNTNTAAHKAILPAGGNLSTNPTTGILMLTGSIMVNSGLTSAVGLLSNATVDDDRFVQIGTDYKFRFYDDAGNLLYNPSEKALVAGTASRFAICYDYLSATDSPTTAVHITLWLDGKVAESFVAKTAGGFLPATVATLCWGEYVSGTARGADMFGDDLTARLSLLTADAPWLIPYPDLRMTGSAALPPTAAGSHTAWTGTFADVDEYPNDADTTKISAGTVDIKETFTYSAANPFDAIGAATIDSVNHRFAHNLAAGKTSWKLLLRDASANESTHILTPAGTTMVGFANDAGGFTTVRPAGGSWVTTDFALTTGVSGYQFGGMAQSSGTPSPGISNITGPEITYYTALLEAGRYPGRSPAVGMY